MPESWEVRSIFAGGHPMLNLAPSGQEAWDLAALLLQDSRYKVIIIASPDGRSWQYPDAPPVYHESYYPRDADA